MATFSDLWQLLYDHGSSTYHQHDCQQIWDSLTPERQQRLYNNISRKLQAGKYVDYNPLCAIHDNMPRKQTLYRQTLSYDEYYRIYRTTTPKDGWEMEKNAEGKVIYVKK